MSFQSAHNREESFQNKEQLEKFAELLAKIEISLNQAEAIWMQSPTNTEQERVERRKYERRYKELKNQYQSYYENTTTTEQLEEIAQQLEEITADRFSNNLAKKIDRQKQENILKSLQRRKRRILTRLALLGAAGTAFLAACTTGAEATINQEPTPIVAEYNPEEEELPTGEVEITPNEEESSPTEIAEEAPTEIPNDPLAVEFVGIDGLSNEVLDNITESTGSFTDSFTTKINQDPALKAALYDSEDGLKVAFYPSNLYFHDGIVGYFTPEGGPLEKNLAIISNAPGSEGEIRFCSISGAGSGLSEADNYLDFAVVSGQNVCMVRNKDDDSVVRITDTNGQWQSPANSGLDMSEVGPRATEAGKNAIEMAQEQEVEATKEAVEMTEQEQIRAEILAAGINLDDLANSTESNVADHPSIESFQQEMDTNFDDVNDVNKLMIVIEIDQITSKTELQAATKTDGGWVALASLKVAYKDADDNWQMASLPIIAYNKKDSKVWFKGALPSSEPEILEGAVSHNMLNYHIDNQVPFLEGILTGYNDQNVYLGVGSFLRLNTDYPDYELWSNNDGMLGDSPRYNASDLEKFRATGDSEVYGYKDQNDLTLIWPFITYNISLSKLNN